LTELFNYFTGNWPKILWLTWQHITIVGVAVGLAIITGIPLGVAAAQNRRLASVVLYTASIIMTIPSMALFGVLIPILALDQSRHRLRAGRDRRLPLFAAADHQQHVRGISVRSIRRSAKPPRAWE
jgi:ABC-type proline/glycine betaine transport system permease subunit